MSKKKNNALAAVMLFLCMFWVALGYYLFNFDYKPSPKPAPRISDKLLKPALYVEESPEGPVAAFSLINAGQGKIRVVDSASLTPLYDVKLNFIPTGATALQRVPSKPWPPRQDGEKFDKERDSRVELVPGSGLMRQIRLGSLFDCGQEGKYTLTVTYQPQTVAKDSDLQDMDVYEHSLSQSTSFDWPIKHESPSAPDPGAAKAAK